MCVNISIILPSLNVANYIEECLESVCKQTLINIEIICVDAGSTDGTQEIIERFCKRNKRIKLIHSDIKSYGYQMNLGIRLASGEYIGIVETDDYVSMDMFKSLYSTAVENDAEVVKADYYQVYTYRNGYRDIAPCHIWNADDNRYNKIINSSSVFELFNIDQGIWKGIYKRDFLMSNHIWFNESYGAAYQDIGFITEVLIKASRIIYMDMPLYYYRLNRPGSSSVSENVLSFCKDEYARLIGMYEHISKKGISGIFLRLVNSFVYESEKLLVKGIDIKADVYNWFVLEVKRALFHNYIFQNMFTDILWEKITEALKGIDEYKNYCGINVKNLCIIDNLNFDFILFGIGIRGRSVLRALDDLGLFPVAIADNSDELIGTSYVGVDIYSPDEVVRRYPNCQYVIANKKYSSDMKQQLINLGIDENQIYIWE